MSDDKEFAREEAVREGLERGSQEPVAEVENITVSYGENVVLKSISLSIEQGSFVGIIGPNGCGKTTFLRTLTRILKPTEGTVKIEGKAISKYDAKTFAKTVGCVSQETDTGFEFSVKDIVLMGRHPHIGRLAPLSKNDFEIADNAMQFTNVLQFKDRIITELSGGERQRVLIAKTLAQQPRILLLDEPTNHLDICHQIEILQLIRSLTPNITVIGVLHDLNLASYFCDQLVLIENGKIIANGTPKEVLTPERVYDVFSTRMIISPHPITGKPYLTPEYELAKMDGGKQIHVISGGGNGVGIFHTLTLYGFKITAGVLSANDSDAIAAETLGIDTIIEPPFSKISAGSIAKLKEMMQKSDAIVVSSMPVSDGNIANLEAVRDLLQETKKPVYLLGRFGDYAKGHVGEIQDELVRDGAIFVNNVMRLVKELR